MNCARCNAFLPPEARFCHVCGLVVAVDASKAAIIDSADSAQANQPASEVAPTSPLSLPYYTPASPPLSTPSLALFPFSFLPLSCLPSFLFFFFSFYALLV